MVCVSVHKIVLSETAQERFVGILTGYGHRQWGWPCNLSNRCE